ncbi:pre-mRNA-processing protein 40A-like [Achlya hypogyna]|uniref:Pre-mRNA-processing protein 40A-like n=1 Tax=Achlya hypogyna TaxID=1202772 RepID=A0A1V9Y5P9_ACHHY|nr:pre-mRNA-processing protein 40A-like [Achlya hypogyna]
MTDRGYVPSPLMKVASMPNPQVDVCAWTEYMDDATGKPYYYHSATKECVWDEPAEYRAFRAAAASVTTATSTVAAAASTSPAPTSTVSTPTTTTSTSATVISEATTTPTVSIPTDSTGIASEAATATFTSENPPSSTSGDADRDSATDAEDDIEKYATMSKAEQVAAFKAMLKATAITPKMKWGEALRAIGDEPAWYALPTIGEKKQAFAEFQTQLAKELDLARRRQQKAAREDFLKLLASCTKISVHTRWHEATTESFGLVTDERFKALADEDERRDLFASFIADLARSERDFAKKKREMHKSTVLAYYASLNIAPDARWTALRDSVYKDEAITQLGLTKRDLEDFFFEHLNEVKKTAAEAQRLARIKAREAEDELAAAFKAHLQAEIAAKRLTPEMRWRDCVDGFEAIPAFAALRTANTILARDIFEAVMDRLHATLRDERQWLVQLVERNGFAMTHGATLASFVAQLRPTVEALLPELLPDSSKARFYGALRAAETVPASVAEWFEHTHRTEVERVERAAAAKKKKTDAFQDLLTEFYFRSDHLDVTWEAARREVEGRSRFHAMDSEADAKAAFDAYMATLREKMQQVLKTRKRDAEDGRPSRERKRRVDDRSSSERSSSRSRSSSRKRRKHRSKHKKKSSKKSSKKTKRSRSRSSR